MSVLFVWASEAVLIILITIILFWLSGVPKIKNSKLSFVMIWLGLNVMTTPLSYFIGGMATASPTSTIADFWTGFFIVQSIPLFILIIVSLKWLFIDWKNI